MGEQPRRHGWLGAVRIFRGWRWWRFAFRDRHHRRLWSSVCGFPPSLQAEHPKPTCDTRYRVCDIQLRTRTEMWSDSRNV